MRVCELAAQGTSGSDLSNTFRKLHTRLEAELHKPVNLDVSLSAEEKNELVKAVMIYELLVREKYDVLRDHFNLQNILISNDEIKQKAKEWHGIYTDEVTMSVGYAAHKDQPDASVDDLEHVADADMYAEKEKHYKERGIERRR